MPELEECTKHKYGDRALVVKAERSNPCYLRPPVVPGYVLAQQHTTGGRGWRYYLYLEENAWEPEEFFEKVVRTGEAFPWLRPGTFYDRAVAWRLRGRTVTIYTPEPGSWIGQGGRWLHALRRAMGGYSFNVQKGYIVYKYKLDEMNKNIEDYTDVYGEFNYDDWVGGLIFGSAVGKAYVVPSEMIKLEIEKDYELHEARGGR